MPITWDEVEDPKLRPDRYTMTNAPEAVERNGDRWADWRKDARGLAESRRRLVRLLEAGV